MAVGDKWSGANLAITIGGTAVPCPQSISVTPTDQFVEYKCPGAAAVERIWTARSWDANIVCFPNNDDADDLNAFAANPGTTQPIVAYPDGNTSGKVKVTFDAFVAPGLASAMDSVGSSTINLVVDGAVTIGTATGS